MKAVAPRINIARIKLARRSQTARPCSFTRLFLACFIFSQQQAANGWKNVPRLHCTNHDQRYHQNVLDQNGNGPLIAYR